MQLSQFARATRRPILSSAAKQRTARVLMSVVAGIALLNLVVFVHTAYASDPEIKDFAGTQGPVVWTFTGTLDAPNPVGMVITFGGLLSGDSVTVDDPAGNFEFDKILNESGVVTAQTTGSEQVEYYVVQ